VDEPSSFKLLDAFVAAGFNSIDTADVYSRWAPGHTGGESETILGKWLKRSGNRDKVIVATKVGLEMGPGKKGLSKPISCAPWMTHCNDCKPTTSTCINPTPMTPKRPIEETLGAYAELIAQGKVRAIGASNFTADRFAAALEISKKTGLPRYDSLQPNYNLYDRADYEAQLEPLCQKEGIGVINYFPLASGFLSGKYRSESDVGKDLAPEC